MVPTIALYMHTLYNMYMYIVLSIHCILYMYNVHVHVPYAITFMCHTSATLKTLRVLQK